MHPPPLLSADGPRPHRQLHAGHQPVHDQGEPGGAPILRAGRPLVRWSVFTRSSLPCSSSGWPAGRVVPAPAQRSVAACRRATVQLDPPAAAPSPPAAPHCPLPDLLSVCSISTCPPPHSRRSAPPGTATRRCPSTAPRSRASPTPCWRSSWRCRMGSSRLSGCATSWTAASSQRWAGLLGCPHAEVGGWAGGRARGPVDGRRAGCRVPHNASGLWLIGANTCQSPLLVLTCSLPAVSTGAQVVQVHSRHSSAVPRHGAGGANIPQPVQA